MIVRERAYLSVRDCYGRGLRFIENARCPAGKAKLH